MKPSVVISVKPSQLAVGAMVLGNLPVPGVLQLDRVGQGWGLFGHFCSHLSFFFSVSLSLGDGPT